MAYTVEFACRAELFQSAVRPFLTLKLKKSDAEAAIAQWSQRPYGQHTFYSCAVREDEPKSLRVGWHASSADMLAIDEVLPHEKDAVSVNEAFVPIRPAVQVGERLGLPTEGYLYHFLEGELIQEYRCMGGNTPRFKATLSRQGEMNAQTVETRPVNFILALWKRSGQVITDQYLLYSRNALGNHEIESVDPAFLEQHGVKLDMDQIIPLTGQAGQRQCHVVTQGDTLSSIAEQHQFAVEKLLALNPHWTDQHEQLKPGLPVYLESVSTYNHGHDIIYPASSILLDQGVFAIGDATKKTDFPVVVVAESQRSQFTALSPIRYAIDTKDETGKGEHPIPDLETFPGGMFKSEQTPYTLRQLRDGWLYVLAQNPETDAWEAREYKVEQGEFRYVAGDTAKERETSEPQPAKPQLLCPSDRPIFLSYAVKRWTQRVQDFYVDNEDARRRVMREVDWNHATHTAQVALIGDYVADLDRLSVFDWSSAGQNSQQTQSDFVKLIQTKTVQDFCYQLPLACDQFMVALDDPFGDLTDLYLKLLLPTLATTLSDEDHRKTLVAESIRSIVRVSIPKEDLPEIAPKDWVDFERAIDACLEYYYYKDVLSPQNDPTGDLQALYVGDLEIARQGYIKERVTLTRLGVNEESLKPYLKEYADRRRAHKEVDWKRLDAYYKSFIDNQAIAYQEIERAFPVLVDAFHTLGTEPLHLGIDLVNPEHMGYLITLISDMLDVLSVTSQQREEAEEKLLNALVQEQPDNLLALVPTFFSSDVYLELDKLLSEASLLQAIKGSNVAIGGAMSAFNDVIGFSLDDQSTILIKTKGLLLPLDQLIESAKASAVMRGAKGTALLSKHLYSTVALLLRSKKIIAGRNAAMATWAAQKIAEGEIEINGRFREETRRLQQRFNDLSKEYLDLKETLKHQTEGSKNYKKTSKRMDKIAKKLAKLVKKTPVFFKAYKQHAGETWMYDASKSASEKFSDIGRMDLVVAGLNAINFLIQMETLVKMNANTPYPDTKLQEQTVVYSAAWLVNSTAAMLRGLSLNQLQGESRLLERSLKYINSEKGIRRFSGAQRKLANQYIQRSMTAAFAGVVAAGLEAWQTVEAFKKADFAEDKVVLGLKTLVLTGQFLSWGGLGFNSLLSRGVGLALSRVLLGWMVAANFWLGLAYMAITAYQILFYKTPMESWLRRSIWGKEPKQDWTAAEEYRELLSLINQPSIQSALVRRSVQTLRSDSAATVVIESEQQFTLFFPRLQEGDSIGLAVNVGHGNQNGMAKTDTTNSRHLSAAELQAGRWEKKDDGLYYQVKLPFLLKQYINYRSKPFSEIVQVFVICMEEDPYAENDDEDINNVSTIYQFQFKPGDLPQTEMAKLKSLLPSQHQLARIEVNIE
ncbi:LysM peptidoglycan-binding domain-containing protein (plasmid) [Photobacterium sp. GJ3]|uniref:LysM peptidoglycan-binding domain-containing protein n=1 Tax=Photobacterium sp. GJ3 TaxID=2829502 RepID=UPI001B8CE1B4|nr:LysM peptidoglycan-binding domain-containing protein [Photobacterium sp. GJ3]QUJ69764.1 LysM peptidoglycan-binding domain-containing protein [Photobacterium sp. GJ3]